MNELVIGDKKYISSKRAAEITGYAKDYVGQLCREGRVEATLVGRSWYVLETSIREHRFGPDEPESVAEPVTETVTAWEPPVYRTEEVFPMPTLEDKSINLLAPEPEISVSEQVEPDSAPSSVEDMQSAWKEWFATRELQETSVPAEPVDVQKDTWEPVVIEPVREETPQYDPVPYTKEIEEPVSLHRSYDIVKPAESTRAAAQEVDHTPVLAKRESAPPKVVSKSRSVRRQGGSMAIKTAFIAVSILGISVALIGTGLADLYIKRGGIEYSMLRFLAGATLIE